jgi:hypothetical protein
MGKGNGQRGRCRMNRWTLEDAAWAIVVLSIGALLIAASLRGDRVAPCHAPRAVPMDTVPCGHLTRCTPTTRARWMSDHPFAAPRRPETR